MGRNCQHIFKIVEKLISKIFLALFLILVIQFAYFGITTTPISVNESDSLAYHIPIAQSLSKFNFVPPVLPRGLGFYPASSEIILALLIFLHIPLNIFCVFGLILLFYFAKKVGEAFGLSKDLSIVFAGSLATLQSVIRWPLTQTVDIWVAVFFLSSLYLLKNPSKSLSYFLKLGISLGFLIGAKYSGIIYGALLLVVFGKNMVSNLNIRRFVYLFIPLALIGMSWYIRNYFITGNPLYPANFLMFSGNPDFPKANFMSWTLLGNIIQNPKYFFKFLEALNSEFPVWWLTLIFPLMIVIRKSSAEVSKLVLLGGAMFLVFVSILPVWPGIEVSNLRFIYPTISVLILSVFLLFKKSPDKIAVFSLLITFISIINLDYHPKILVPALLVSFWWVFRK